MYIKSNKNQIDYKMNFILKCKTETFFYIYFTKTKSLSPLSLTAHRRPRYSRRELSTVASDGPPLFEERYNMHQLNNKK